MKEGSGAEGAPSYAQEIDRCTDALLAHICKATSCEVEVAARRSEIDVIREAARAVFWGGASEPAIAARPGGIAGKAVGNADFHPMPCD